MTILVTADPGLPWVPLKIGDNFGDINAGAYRLEIVHASLHSSPIVLESA